MYPPISNGRYVLVQPSPLSTTEIEPTDAIATDGRFVASENGGGENGGGDAEEEEYPDPEVSLEEFMEFGDEAFKTYRCTKQSQFAELPKAYANEDDPGMRAKRFMQAMYECCPNVRPEYITYIFEKIGYNLSTINNHMRTKYQRENQGKRPPFIKERAKGKRKNEVKRIPNNPAKGLGCGKCRYIPNGCGTCGHWPDGYGPRKAKPKPRPPLPGKRVVKVPKRLIDVQHDKKKPKTLKKKAITKAKKTAKAPKMAKVAKLHLPQLMDAPKAPVKRKKKEKKDKRSARSVSPTKKRPNRRLEMMKKKLAQERQRQEDEKRHTANIERHLETSCGRCMPYTSGFKAEISNKEYRSSALTFSWNRSDVRMATHAKEVAQGYEEAANLRSKFKENVNGLVRIGRSPVHEWGLFASVDIPKGTNVIEYIGQKIRGPLADLREKFYESNGMDSSYLFRVGGQVVLDATVRGGPARYINHSCDPNCKPVQHVAAQKIIISSIQDIKQGEELFYDYKFEREADEFKIPCSCGTSKCSGYLN